MSPNQLVLYSDLPDVWFCQLKKHVAKHAWQNYLPASRLVFEVLSGANLGLDVLQVRHGCNRSDRGTRSQWTRWFGRGAHHRYFLHLLSRGGGPTGRAAATTTVWGFRWVSWWWTTTKDQNIFSLLILIYYVVNYPKVKVFTFQPFFGMLICRSFHGVLWNFIISAVQIFGKANSCIL